MTIVEPGEPGETRFFFDFFHRNGTNIQLSSTITSHDPQLMDQAFQDMRDLLDTSGMVDPETPFYAYKIVNMQYTITPDEPAS